MKLLWQQIPSTVITEIFCNSQFDGVVFDLEHGTFNNESLFNCIQVCELMGKKSFVRLTTIDHTKLRLVLDAGVSGVILSTVETYEQAKEFKNYCTYPKNGGRRGQGLVRENKWGKDKLRFRQPIVIPQIETKKGVDNLEDIKKLNFDYYLVGPYDLSASLGIAGDFSDSKFVECFDKIKSLVPNFGLHIPSNVRKIYNPLDNIPLLVLGMDTTFLIESIDEMEKI